MVEVNRAESTDLYTGGSEITTKIQPPFDGSMSWFNYGELIDDWLELAVIETAERGLALKNRLIGVAELGQGLEPAMESSTSEIR